jgi:hypothetical protein
MSLSSSRSSKQEADGKESSQLITDFSLSSHYDFENGGDMFLRIVNGLSPDYKMEAICSSESSIDSYQTRRYYIPESRNESRGENPKATTL